MSGAAAPPRRSGGGKVKARLLRIGLALAGGGPLGGIYEIGALLALSESLDGRELDDRLSDTRRSIGGAWLAPASAT